MDPGAQDQSPPRGRNSVADVWGTRTPYAGEGRWPVRVDQELAGDPERWVQSACVLCSNGCGLDIAVSEGRMVGVRGRAADHVNRGRLGPKGLEGWRANASADRLRVPLIRAGGKLRAATWDEALDLIVARSKELIHDHTSSSIGFYTSGQLMLEEYYTLAVIGRAGIGTPHMDGNTRLCTATAAASLKESFGCDGQPSSYADLDTADCLLLVGHNLAETATVLWMKVLDRRRGPRPPALIVIDVRETATAREADLHLVPRPGTNVAVLNGLLNLVIEGGGVDQRFVAAHTVGFDRLARTVAHYPPERVAEIAGIPPDRLRAAAGLLVRSQRLMSTVLQGVYQSMQATAAAVQVNNLQLIRGMIGKPGCGVLQMNGQPTAQNARECGADGDLPGFRNWSNPDHVKQLADLWDVTLDQIPHWAPPTHALQIFDYAEQGSIKLLWIQATNPAVSLPDLARVRAILAKPELFVVAQDIFPTETTALADVVLPAAAWGEKTGTFTNADRTVHLAQQAVAPPGEARSDLDIFLDYARRMDFRDRSGRPLIKWHDPETAFAAWQACSRGRPCDYSGLSYAKLAGGSGIRWPCTDAEPDGAARLYSDGRFPTAYAYCEDYGHDLVTGAVVEPLQYKAIDPQGKARLKDAEYQAPHEQPDETYPFWLTTGRVVYHFHTRTKTGRAPALQAAAPDVFVEINADDAQSRGLAEGDWARIASRRGEIEARVKIGGIAPGCLFIPFHYGSWDQPDRKRAANELTLYAWDPVSKQPQFKYAAVALARIAAPATTRPDAAAGMAARIVEGVRHAAGAAAALVKPERQHIREYLGLLHGSEQGFAAALDMVADAHASEPDVLNLCRVLAGWSRRELADLAQLIARYGEAHEAEPERIAKALKPKRRQTGFGLVRDLHDCWLLAQESHVSLVVLDQAAKALRDAEMMRLIERMVDQNQRQRSWLFTRIKQAAPQALIVPA